ncbi:hypothetical protein BH24ACT5_BH24ACT5_05190 [soil metagenome]
MTTWELNQRYFEAQIHSVIRRGRHDDAGEIDEKIVVVAAGVIGAAAVAAIIWTKLRDGANNIQTPAP